MENILEIRDLNVEFHLRDGVARAVNHLNLTLGKGETLGLVGETGAGKTTTALSVMGLVQSPPGRVKGEILFEGRDLLKLGKGQMRKIRGGEISMIFQDPMTSLNPIDRVGDQIAEVIRLHGTGTREDARKKAREMLSLVGIDPDRYDDYPHQFSGGMKQRVVIAIALACNPSLLIADEPTTALDVTIQAQVLDLMRKLREREKMSMILITHDLGVVAEICDKVAIMYAGEVVEVGSLEQIFHRPSHPYTQGLFRSLPNMASKVHRLTPIQGLMPDPQDLPEGCKFAPRCDRAKDCPLKRGSLRVLEEGHLALCDLAGEKEESHG